MEPKIIFVYDKKMDMENLWQTSNAKGSFGKDWKGSVTGEVYRMCHGKAYEDCKDELKKRMDHFMNMDVARIVAKLFNEAWKGISKEYFMRLEKIMKEPFPLSEVRAYLTTAGRCPYNYSKKNPLFFARFFGGIPGALHTAGHELMHIHFHNSRYWKMCEDEIGKKKTMDLKEALTVLLNLEFQDLWMEYDQGYPNHQEMRAYIRDQWKKGKDFDKLIASSIKWIKKNGIK